MRSRVIRRIGVIAATAAMATLLPVASAYAGGNGSITGTQHVHGPAWDLVVLDFLPQDNPPPLPAGCWANATMAIMSTNGNAIQHFTTNKAGDFWFTTTYTGDAAVYPVAQPVSYDSNGNVVLDTSGPALYTGHLTTWFGQEDNQQNGVMHATASFHGTDAAGNAVNLNAHLHFSTNANGQPTAQVASATC